MLDPEAMVPSAGQGIVGVTVRADDAQLATVEAVMGRHTAIDPMARRAEYQGAGWTQHDETAGPYSPTTTSSGLPPRADVP